jgi:phosphopantothenoylcysteine decarboxylase/phosphopantothenate--cysteine ligase
MGALRNKSILVGVTGSIAAYKAAEIVRLLRKKEAIVYPIMTKAATHFLPPLTLQNLASQKVTLKLFSRDIKKAEHLSLAELADACLIAPATANIIGKIANGIADDILTTIVLATKAPVLLAPAMNNMMYENPILQRNIGSLKAIGFKFIGPARGDLADGKIGLGRMTEPQEIVECLERVMQSRDDFLGKAFVVTAGPTREPLDRVRFFSNYSSGKMGYALAEEGASRGARIVLISGPTSLDPPSGVEFHWVESAREMRKMVKEKMGKADGMVMSAAVSDYAPAEKKNGKIKKTTQKKFILELVQNPDILKELGQRKENKILVGFCVETKDLEKEALRKLKEKSLDLIVANNITEEGAGFEGDTNIVTLINNKGKVEHLSRRSKREVARVIWDKIKEMIENRDL